MNTTAAVQLSADAVRRLHELAEQRMRDLENGRSDALPPDEVIRDSHVR